MTKKILHILFLIFLFGCSQNLWITQTVLRPKKPKFSLLKEPFKNNSFINNKYLYTSTKLFTNYDGNIIVSTYGFCTDGKFILNSFYKLNIDSFIANRISWDSSFRIGYYTTKGNDIKFQYFEQYGGGEYKSVEGIIKPDTIIISEKFRDMPWKITIRYDTLIKSVYPLQ